jgi:hypothetical protein
MLESDADRLASIKWLGGQLVSHAQGEFWALFDNDFQQALGDGMVESRGPALTARLVDVEQLRKDTVLNVAGKTFKLKKAEPEESTGFSVLLLGR